MMLGIKRVTAKSVTGNGLWYFWTGRKKFTIQCGNCGHCYQDKVYFDVSDEATSPCPSCRSLNIWSLSRFDAAYEKDLKRREA